MFTCLEVNQASLCLTPTLADVRVIMEQKEPEEVAGCI